METLLLLVCAAVGVDIGPVEVHAPKEANKVVTPLHFGVNAEFSRPGIFAGTLPADDPRSKSEAFAAALRESGIRTLRLPGGDASYFYLPEGRLATMELAHASGEWDFGAGNPGSKEFATLDNLARFARQRQLGLIYQLPMLFHLDQGRPRASIRSVFSTQAKNYDHDRIEAQADYAAEIIGRLRKLQAPMVAWELGNEEWAHCRGADYARTAAAIIRRIRQQDRQTPIVAVSGGDKWFTECVGELRRQGVLEQIQSFNVHYPFGTWPGPPTPAQRANLRMFAEGDLEIARWFDAGTKERTALGIPTAPMAVTETMVFLFDDKHWDSYRVIGTHAHALVYAWNWTTLLADPRCNMAVFHDLESTFFGMMRYDVGYDEAARQFVWLGAAKPEQKVSRFPDQYLLSPTGAANRLLSELMGCRVGLATVQPADSSLRILWGNDPTGRVLLVAVHRWAERKKLTFPGLAVEKADALTADDLASVLPGQYRVASLAVRSDQPRQIELPPWSVSFIRLRP